VDNAFVLGFFNSSLSVVGKLSRFGVFACHFG